MVDNAEQARLIKGIVRLSKVSKQQRQSHLQMLYDTLSTQGEIIEYKRLLVEEDKKIVAIMFHNVAKEDSGGQVINAFSERSE